MNIQYQSTNLQMINNQTNVRQNNLLRLRMLNSQVDEDTKIKTNIKLSNSNSISNAVNVDISTFSLSPTMQAKVRALNETSRSNIETQSKISLYQTANSSLNEVYLTLKRMKELANKSANDTTTDDERRQIQLEIDDLTNEINNIVSNTKFAGQSLLDGSQKASTHASKGTASADAYTSSSNIGLKLDGSVNTSVSDVIQFTVTGRPSNDEVQIKLETLFGTPSENDNFNVHNSGSSDYENIEGNVTNTEYHYTTNFSGIGSLKITGDKAIFTSTDGTISSGEIIKNGNLISVEIDNKKIEIDISSNKASLTTSQETTINDITSGVIIQKDSYYTLLVSGFGSVKFDGINVTFTSTDGVAESFTAVQSGNNFSVNIKGLEIKFNPVSGKATITQTQTVSTEVISSGVLTNTTNYQSFNFSGVGSVKFNGTNVTFISNDGTVLVGLSAVQNGNTLSVDIKNMKVEFDTSTGKATLSKLKSVNTQVTTSGVVTSNGSYSIIEFEGLGTVKFEGTKVTVIANDGTINNYTAVQSENLFSINMNNMRIEFNNLTKEAKLIKSEMTTSNVVNSGTLVSNNLIYNASFSGIGSIRIDGSNITFIDTNGIVSQLTAVQSGNILKATIGNMTIQFDKSTNQATLTKPEVDNVTTTSNGTITNTTTSYNFDFSSVGNVKIDGNNITFTDTTGVTSQLTAVQSGNILKATIGNMTIEFDSSTNQATLTKPKVDNVTTTSSGSITNTVNYNSFNFAGVGVIKFSDNSVTFNPENGGAVSNYTAVQSGTILSAIIGNMKVTFDTSTGNAELIRTDTLDIPKVTTGIVTGSGSTYLANFGSEGIVRFSGTSTMIISVDGLQTYAAQKSGDIFYIDIDDKRIEFNSVTKEAKLIRVDSISSDTKITGTLNSSGSVNTFNFDNFGSVKFSGTQVAVTNLDSTTSIYTATQTGNILSVNVNGATINFDTATNKATITQTVAVSGTQAIAGNLNSTQTTSTFNFDNFGSVKFSGNKVAVTNLDGITNTYTATQTDNILSVNVNGATINFDTVTNKATITQTVAISGNQVIAGNLNSTQTTSTFNFDNFGSVKFSGNKVAVTNLDGTTNTYTATQTDNILSVNVNGATINFDTVTNKATITQTVAISGNQTINVNASEIGSYQIFNFDNIGEIKINGTNVTFTKAGTTTETAYTATQNGDMISVNMDDMILKFDKSTNSAIITESEQTLVDKIVNGSISNNTSYYTLKFSGLGKFTFNDNTKNVTFISEDGSTVVNRAAVQNGNIFTANINGMEFKFDTVTKKSTITKLEQVQQTEKLSGSLISTNSSNTFNFDGIGSIIFNGKDVTFVPLESATSTNYTAIQSGNMFSVNINDMTFKFDSTSKKATVSKLEETEISVTNNITNINSDSYYEFKFDSIGTVKVSGTNITFTKAGTTTETTYTATQSGNLIKATIDGMTFKFDISSGIATISRPQQIDVEKITSGSISEKSISNTIKFDGIGTVKFSGSHAIFTKEGSNVSTIYSATQSGNLISADIDGMKVTFDIVSGKANLKIDTNRTETINTSATQSGNLYSANFDGVGTVKFSGTNVTFTKAGTTTETTYTATQIGNIISVDIGDMTLQLNKASGNISLTKPVDTPIIDRVKGNATTSSDNIKISSGKIYLEFGGVRLTIDNADELKSGDTIILKIYGNEKPYIADSLDGEKAGINSVKPSDLNIVDADGNSLNVTDQNYARMAAEAYDMAIKQVSKEFDKIDAYIKELQGAIDTGTNDGSDGDSGRFEMITGKDKDKITDDSDRLIHIHSYNSTEELVKLLSAI